MAGVIDASGQWEHCNCCGKFVLIQDLYYGVPTKEAQKKHSHTDSPWITSGEKLDLCGECAPASAQY